MFSLRLVGRINPMSRPCVGIPCQPEQRPDYSGPRPWADERANGWRNSAAGTRALAAVGAGLSGARRLRWLIYRAGVRDSFCCFSPSPSLAATWRRGKSGAPMSPRLFCRKQSARLRCAAVSSKVELARGCSATFWMSYRLPAWPRMIRHSGCVLRFMSLHGWQRVAPHRRAARFRVDRIRLRASLRSPPGPVAPGAWDFGRQSWFQGVGAVGFSYGAAELLAPLDERRARGISVWLRNFAARHIGPHCGRIGRA